MTEGDPSLHYTNPLSLVLLGRNNLIQGWIASRGAVSALRIGDDNAIKGRGGEPDEITRSNNQLCLWVEPFHQVTRRE